MTISIIKALPNLYTGKKIKKIINIKNSKLKEKKYKKNQFLTPTEQKGGI